MMKRIIIAIINFFKAIDAFVPNIGGTYDDDPDDPQYKGPKEKD